MAAPSEELRPVDRSPEEEALLREAERVFPAGVVANLHLGDYLFVPVRGEGSRIYDKSGNEWIDYRCGTGCLILGHGHPRVLKAVEEQIRQATNFAQILNEPAIHLAAKVIEIIPSGEQVRFTNSGGEATFMAMRVARAHTGKDKILKFEGAYHGPGDYMANMLPEGYEKARVGHPGMAGIPKSAWKDYIAVPFNDIEAVTKAIEDNIDELAGLIVEPILGFIPPRPGYLAALREVTTKYDVPLIFDECVTGFWTALGGAQEYYDVVPDITAIGKSFGGGFPIAAVCAKKEIMDRFDYVNQPPESVAFCGASTYGHPVGATASLATIAELEKPGVYETMHENGRKIREGITEVIRRHNVPSQVMGTGPTWLVVFTKDEVVDYRSAMTEDSDLKTKFIHGLWANRVHIVGRGYVSLAHDDKDIEETIEACDSALRHL